MAVESGTKQTITAVAGVLTMVGVLSFALFPLAIPILILVTVLGAPLLLPALPLVLAFAWLARRRGSGHSSGRPSSQAPAKESRSTAAPRPISAS